MTGVQTCALPISTAVGGESVADGIAATAFGWRAHAEGERAHAFGHISEADGDFALAVGEAAKANFANSAALGSNVAASGENDFAIGNVDNDYSLAGLADTVVPGGWEILAVDGSGRLVTATFTDFLDGGGASGSSTSLVSPRRSVASAAASWA